MKLYQKLQEVSSEEDVKDAYINALKLKAYQKNLIDIQTKEIWFEAKDSARNSTYAMFTQLLHYVQDALNKGEYIPPFLCVIDTGKAAIMSTKDVLPFLKKKTINWGTSASQYTQEALDEVSAYIGSYLVSFNIQTHEEEFISTIKDAIKTGGIIRIQITPDNLKQVFDKWEQMIGREILNISEKEYDLLFFADIMHDGTASTHKKLPAELLHKDEKPVFQLGGKIYELGHVEGYRRFWAIYQKPPKAEYRDYILERRDSLIPNDERIFKGAYYTPLHLVDKAYEKLNDVLGKNWQKDYIIWDMCCGVGNLEVKHSNHRNLFMSTLDNDDIEIMRATKTCVAANRFQYDYLNDDINDSGEIDYNITEKVPKDLREAILEKKKILVLINPPYAESGSGIGKGKLNKKEVEKTQINKLMKTDETGYASKELFVQFLARISAEIPTATIAMFSTLKYINAPNFEKFRQKWSAKYLGGFIVHNKSFDGLKGNFPIGFLMWKTDQKRTEKWVIDSISTDVLDKNIKPIGEKKFFNLPTASFLNVWMKKSKTNNELALPLSNAITISKNPRKKMSCDNMKGFLFAGNNDLQNASTGTLISSSIYTGRNGGGVYLDDTNIWQAAIVFSVRRLIKPTWLNDRDQFLQTNENLTDEFKNDCLVWMLFNGSNLTASANEIEWKGKNWSLVNHFIPFNEQEVNAPERFESDFMVQYMADKKFSDEAKAVITEGKKLWQAYFEHTDSRNIREELRLNRADVGWYQIRKVIEYRNSSEYYPAVSFIPFKEAYNSLTKKLQPMVYDLGFLKR